MSWEPVEQVAKNEAGQFVALIGGNWEPVEQAAKNDQGKFVVLRSAKQQEPARQQAEQTPMSERTDIRGNKVAPTALEDVGSFVSNVATGASGLMRGSANLISPGLGEKIWPKAIGSEGSVGKVIGQVLDPAALAVGGGILKAIPYAPVLGSGLLGGLTNLGKNLGAGAAMGGTIGALSDEGSAESGAAAGAVANVVLPPVVSGVTKSAGKIWDVLVGRYGAARAGQIARAAAGGDVGAIKAAAAAAPADVTATQATAGVKNDVWDALGELAKTNDRTNYFSRLAQRQEDSSRAAISGLAGAQNQTEARTLAQTGKRALNTITTPMRDVELAAANASGGLQLEAKAVTGGISKLLENPSVGTNPNTAKALNVVSAQIDDWAQKSGGVIDAEALYGIRKNLNSTIESLLGTGDPKAVKSAAASIAAKVRPMIDQAITDAGGTGWKNYLTTFERGMQEINKGKMASTALNLFEKQPTKFESLVSGNEPKAVEKIFGSGRYDIEQEVGRKGMRVLEKVAGDLARDRSIQEGAKRGGQSINKIIEENGLDFILPNWIDRNISITNRVMRAIESKLNKSTVDALYAGMKSGQSAAKMLEAVPTSEKLTILKSLIPYMEAGVVSGEQ